MTLVSTTTDDGTGLTSGSYYGFVIDANTASEEYVVGTASGTQIVSMLRGVSVITGNTEIAALKFEHRRGASVKIADAPVLLVLARILNGNETIPNVLTYDSSVGTSSFTNNQMLASKLYVDSVTVAGGVPITASVPGIGLLSSKPQFAAGTATGSYLGTNYNLLPPNSFFNSTSTATTTGVVTMPNGLISPGFISTSSDYVFGGNLTFSGYTTSTKGITFSATTTHNGNFILNGTLKNSTGTQLFAQNLFSTSTIFSSSNADVEMTYATTTIPAGLFASKDTLYIRVNYTAEKVAGAFCRHIIRYGGSVIASTTDQQYTPWTTYVTGMVESWIDQRGATNSQFGTIRVTNNPPFSYLANTGTTSTVFMATGSTAIDSTQSQTLSIGSLRTTGAGVCTTTYSNMVVTRMPGI